MRDECVGKITIWVMDIVHLPLRDVMEEEYRVCPTRADIGASDSRGIQIPLTTKNVYCSRTFAKVLNYPLSLVGYF